MGMLAATVSPARRPTYTVTAPKRMPNRPPRISARAVSSGRVSVAGTNGLNAGFGGAVVAMRVAISVWFERLTALHGSVSVRQRFRARSVHADSGLAFRRSAGLYCDHRRGRSGLE